MRGNTDFAVMPMVPTSPRNRYCAEPGCHVRLSIYNHGRYCALHEDDEFAGTMKKCSGCGTLKPIGHDNWHMDKTSRDGWHASCKACRSGYQKAAHARRRLSEHGGMARCRVCDEVKARDGDHWAFGAKGRLIQPCLDCQAATAQRKREYSVERYYRKKYHMSREQYQRLNPGSSTVMVTNRSGNEVVMEVGP